jgi:hypothetical protein
VELPRSRLEHYVSQPSARLESAILRPIDLVELTVSHLDLLDHLAVNHEQWLTFPVSLIEERATLPGLHRAPKVSIRIMNVFGPYDSIRGSINVETNDVGR